MKTTFTLRDVVEWAILLALVAAATQMADALSRIADEVTR